jgi:hypothetical protein
VIFSYLLLFSSISQAQDGKPIQVVFYCETTKDRKTVAIFKQGDNLTYQFGDSVGKPELQIVQSEQDVEKTPWPGIGGTYWNSITFTNKSYSYVIQSRYERNESAKVTAGVTVYKAGNKIASLDRQTTSGFVDQIGDFVE